VLQSQILKACSFLEELTLCGCTHNLVHESSRYSCPFLGATAARLDGIWPSSSIGVPYALMMKYPVTGYRGLRDLQLHWSPVQQHAHITRYMLKDLAAVPSVSIFADSVMLRMPGALDPLPAALKIVARSMQLVRSGTAAELNTDLVSFHSRCQLVIEGVCLDEVVASWVPLTERDYFEDYRAWTYWARNKLEPCYAATDDVDDDAVDADADDEE